METNCHGDVMKLVTIAKLLGTVGEVIAARLSSTDSTIEKTFVCV